MFYIVYKIVHRDTGKEYIGTHKTIDPNDDYMGSGTYLKYAQNKYGIDAFNKEILYIFDNPTDMYSKEAELVTEDYLATANTYNLMVGGSGGFDFINENLLNNKNRKPTFGFKGKKHTKESRKKISSGQKGRVSPSGMLGKNQSEETKRKISEKNKGKQPSSGMTGKKHSAETIEKMRLSALNKRKNL